MFSLDFFLEGKATKGSEETGPCLPIAHEVGKIIVNALYTTRQVLVTFLVFTGCGHQRGAQKNWDG